MVDISDNESRGSRSEHESTIEDDSTTNGRSIPDLKADQTVDTPDANNKNVEDSINRKPPATPDGEHPPKCPNRIVTFFLPPGFHNWTNAFGFVSEFFFFSKLGRQAAKAKGAVFGCTAPTLSRRQEMRIHEDFIVLTEAEGEKNCGCDFIL